MIMCEIGENEKRKISIITSKINQSTKYFTPFDSARRDESNEVLYISVR